MGYRMSCEQERTCMGLGELQGPSTEISCLATLSYKDQKQLRFSPSKFSEKKKTPHWGAYSLKSHPQYKWMSSHHDRV